MKNCIRNHYFVAFFVTLALSIGMLVTSFFLPPQGQVDPSVLQATAIIFAWPALAFAAKALDDNKRIKISTKVGTVTVGQHHNEETFDNDEISNDDPIMMEGEEE